MQHFIAIVKFKLELQSGNAQSGSNSTILAPCDLETWRMTVKNYRAPLLSNIKPYVSFHHHMWIETGVTVRKRLSWVVTSVTLTFDFWPWPFAWTLPWSLVITPENFMIIRWWEHSQKGVTDGQADGQTYGQKNTIHRAAWSQLKYNHRTIFNIGRNKSPDLNVSRLVLQLSLPDPLKPDVKWRMRMYLEQRRQAVLQMPLGVQQLHCPLRCGLY